MEYLPSYKDSLYLEHHGVLGMKWGVRRYQNPDGSLTAKGHQRRLQQLDYDRRNSASTAANLAATSRQAMIKTQKFKSKGKIEKAKKFEKRANDASRLYNKEVDNYIRKGEEFAKAIADVEKSGYAWKSTPVDFQSTKTTARGKEFMKNNGVFSMVLKSNSASGNRFKVRESVSDRTRDRWQYKKNIQSPRPQRIVYQ